MIISVRDKQGKFVEIPTLVGEAGASAPALWLSEDKASRYLCVGANCNEGAGATNGFNGTITSARVYSSALTPDQIMDRYLLSPSISHRDCAAVIGDTEYSTLDEALANVAEGDTVTIMAGAHGRPVIESGTYKNITIIGETGSVLDGLSFYVDLKNVTIQNLVFVGSALGVYAAHNADGLTVRNCTFNGSYHSIHVADTEKLGYTYSNIVVDNCKFNMTGSGKYTAVYTQIVDGLTVKDCNFNKVNFNAVQIASGASGNITIINNTFANIGSRNLNLAGIGDDFAGTLTIYGNRFSVPTMYPKEKGNYVLLWPSEGAANCVIGINTGIIDASQDNGFYYYKCEQSSDAKYNSVDQDNKTASSLIVDIDVNSSGQVFNTIDGVSLIEYGTSLAASGNYIGFTGDIGYALKTFDWYYPNITHGITVEANLSVSDQNNSLILGNLLDDRGFGLRLNAETGLPEFTVYIGGLGYITASSSINLDANTFYHVVGTYDGEYVRIYVDGVETASKCVFKEPYLIMAEATLDSSGNTVLTMPEGTVIKEGTLLCFPARNASDQNSGIVINGTSYILQRLLADGTTAPVISTYYSGGDTLIVRITRIEGVDVALIISIMFGSCLIPADRIYPGVFGSAMSSSLQPSETFCFRSSKIVTEAVEPEKDGDMVWMCS